MNTLFFFGLAGSLVVSTKQFTPFTLSTGGPISQNT